MASLQERKRRGESAFLIQFALNGKRRSLFLGSKYSRSFAEETMKIVENVVAALETDSNVDKRTRGWLEAIEPDLRERFERAGLIEPEIRLTLGELFDAYFRVEEPGMKPITFRNKLRSTKLFFEVFKRGFDVAAFGKREVAQISRRSTRFTPKRRGPELSATSRAFSAGPSNRS